MCSSSEGTGSRVQGGTLDVRVKWHQLDVAGGRHMSREVAAWCSSMVWWCARNVAVWWCRYGSEVWTVWRGA